MAQDTTNAPQTSTPNTSTPKKGGALKWILIVIGVLFALGLCCCVGSVLFFIPSLKNNEDFKEGYCEEWTSEGYTSEEDPFGICN